MALSRQTITSDGTTRQYPITLADGYLSKSEISIYIEPEVQGDVGVAIPFTWINDLLVELEYAPTSGINIIIERNAQADSRLVVFKPTYIKDTDLNTMYKHLLYLAQEVLDGRFKGALGANLNMGFNRIYNLGAPQQPNDAVRLVDIKTYTDLAESLNNQNAAHEAAAKQSELNAKASASSASADAAIASNTTTLINTTITPNLTAIQNAGANATSAELNAQLAVNASSAAATSATNASTSATNANNAMTSAQNSATSAANSVNGFQDVVDTATSAFNNNVTTKTTAFNTNAVSKTNDFDGNTASKTLEYNTNADTKVAEYNVNAAQKQAQVDASVVAANTSETNAAQSATNAANSEDNAEIWAVGTDTQVSPLGGTHSAKGWAEVAAQGQIQSDWNQADNTQKDYIRNKPTNLSQFTNDIDTLTITYWE